MHRLSFVTAVALLFAAGCSGPQTYNIEDTRAGAFTLSVDDGTYLDGGSGELYMTTAQTEGGVEVQVRARDAKALKACYFELQYNPAVLNPVAAQAQALAEDGAQVLELARMADAGSVQFGAVLAHYDEQPGFSGDGLLATVRFERAAFAPQVRAASDAAQLQMEIYAFGIDLNRRSRMEYDPETNQVKWYYFQPGDYDQNGEVNLADLSRLGKFFLSQIDTVHNPAVYTEAKYVVDGDGNGEINIADLVPIAAGYGTQVSGYSVHAMDNVGLGYPYYKSQIDTGDQYQFGNVPFSAAQGDKSAQRVWFTFDAGEHKHQWVWAKCETNRDPSNGQPTRYAWTSVRPAPYDLYDWTGWLLHYDGGMLTWAHSLWGDFDQNSEVNVADLSTIGATFDSPNVSDPFLIGWFVNGYHNGRIRMEDQQYFMELFGSSPGPRPRISGYAIFGTADELQAPQDPYAEELLAPLAIVDFNASNPFAFIPQHYDTTPRRNYTYTFAALPASGTYMWVRPVIGEIDSGEYGTRSGLVQVP
jgi:hypothetical protein